MPKMVRSARGEMVDFDKFKVKQILANAPAPTEVKARENFVERRLKRKLKNKSVPSVEEQMKQQDAEELKQEQTAEPAAVEQPVVETKEDPEE